MTDIKDIIARNIRRYRSTLKISQEELAHKSTLHRTYIGSVERSERNISIENLEKIATALGVTVDKLVKRDENEL